MIYSGLVSVTFRDRTPREIVDLVTRAGLVGIEWGGDVHVPHGDLSAARRVGDMTRAAGLTVACYGSYYRVGHGEPVPFERVLETAAALKAPMIRVWAGQHGSAEAEAAYRSRVVADSVRIAELAGKTHIKVAYELHGNTLTDTQDSTTKLLSAAGHDNLSCYFQSPIGWDEPACLDLLDALADRLANLHVYHWVVAGDEQLQRPLSEGAAVWLKYLRKAAAAPGNRYAMLEFVRDKSTESFMADAAALSSLIGDLTPK